MWLATRVRRVWTASLKAFGMRWSGQGGGTTGLAQIFRLGRTNYQYYTDVGDGRGNSIVMSVVLWICRNFPQADIQVSTMLPDGTSNPIPRHDLSLAIKKPNPYYSGQALWYATLADLTVTGNAYWLIAKGQFNTLGELWWVPSTMIRPRWNENGTKFIEWYDYIPDPSRANVVFKLKPEEVVHFRYGLDPDNTRLGLSPLASLLREVWTDDEAANFSATLLRNLGVPGVIISPNDAETEIQDEDAEAMKLKYMANFGQDRRGEPLVIGSNVKVQIVSFSPQQMNFDQMRRLPEERVTAVFGVNAIVAGLGVGLAHSTFRNYKEARAAAYEENILPMHQLVAAELEQSLLPLYANGDNLSVMFDTSKLSVFLEDNALRSRTANLLVLGGWITVGAGMRSIGMPADTTYDYYLRKNGTTPVPLAEGGNPVAPPQPALGAGATNALPAPGTNNSTSNSGANAPATVASGA